MEPWNFVVTGSKSDIIAGMPKSGLPDCAQAAVIALLAPYAEVPGWTDEEPGETWAKHVKAHPEKHSALEERPPDRETYLATSWKVATSGHPDAHGVSTVTVEAVISKKAVK